MIAAVVLEPEAHELLPINATFTAQCLKLETFELLGKVIVRVKRLTSKSPELFI